MRLRYLKLIDEENYNMLIKAEGREQYRYIFGKNEWIRSGILMKYYDEKSDKYDLYEEISEKEVYEMIEMQKEEYKKLYQYALDETRNNFIKNKKLYDFITKKGGFQNIEIDIVGLVYCLGESYYQKIKKQKRYNLRITNALDILFEKTNYNDKNHLVALRTNTNAHNIIKIVVLQQYEDGKIEKEKYEFLRDYFENKII